MWQEIFSKFVMTLLLALVTALVPLAVKWVVEMLMILKNNAMQRNREVFEVLTWVAKEAVKAAEQAGAAGFIQDKKKYAIDFIERWMQDNWKMDLDIDLIADAVEAAVFEELNYMREIPHLPEPMNSPVLGDGFVDKVTVTS